MNVAVDSLLSLSSVERFSTPFDYFVSPHALKGDLSTRVLDWFETEAPWKLVETDFYEQYEFSLWDVELPPPLLVLREPRLLDQLKVRLAISLRQNSVTTSMLLHTNLFRVSAFAFILILSRGRRPIG